MRLKEKFGAPGEVRTRNLWRRRPTLYPIELRVQYLTTNIAYIINFIKNPVFFLFFYKILLDLLR